MKLQRTQKKKRNMNIGQLAIDAAIRIANADDNGIKRDARKARLAILLQKQFYRNLRQTRLTGDTSAAITVAKNKQDTARKTSKHAATKKAIQKAYMVQRCRTRRKKLLRRLRNSKKRKGHKEGDQNEVFHEVYESEEEFPHTCMELEKHDVGGPTAVFPHCQAMMWDEERTNKSQKNKPPEFGLCCLKRTVKLPLLR
ncbi:uncharacterized protein LOC113272352 [Papaver somniferum]|uniref:uncharacterized protein LOC113272352 n=1 Tax=Papaver somniferum TaxID=3469 RepID=UPI000E6F9B78|nr:uncharacterized protein LOC113272352 [Papaver somniferum]